LPRDADARITYDVFALAEVQDERYKDLADAIGERLANFDCARSDHLQDFARGKVHNWEKHGHSRTYVMVTPTEDSIDVAAFFTIGMTALSLENAPTSVRKKLMGNINLDQTGAYSIAELARSDNYSSAQLPGSLILDEAKSVIRRARQVIAGRFVVVDAREEVFASLYEPAGFKRIDLAESPRGMEGVKFVTACAQVRDW
jgi:hypothetical protein